MRIPGAGSAVPGPMLPGSVVPGSVVRLALMALLAGTLTACGAASEAPTSVPSRAHAASVSAGSGAAVALVSAAPSVPGSGSPSGPSPSGPSPSPSPSPSVGLFEPARTLEPGASVWPADVIDAAIALAVLDRGIEQAGSDLATAAQQQDMHLFLGAASGLAKIVEEGTTSAQRLASFDATKAVGEAYIPVLTQLDAASSGLANALQQGDGPGVQASSAQLGAALEAYRGVRAGMVGIADRALLMRRSLVQ